MKLWLDAQLSPTLARWLEDRFEVEVLAVQTDPSLLSAGDEEIFDAARAADVVVMTKDRDFVDLLKRLGPPPKILWVTVGNTSNAVMKDILSKALSKALEQLERGEDLVEISRIR
ncbi:MAG: DUF5615 family PIN-like protein [Thioalkalivibrio sp.]|nr:DUF5615 family PIN-like protein [Thioalkalivibrio sp.]